MATRRAVSGWPPGTDGGSVTATVRGALVRTAAGLDERAVSAGSAVRLAAYLGPVRGLRPRVVDREPVRPGPTPVADGVDTVDGVAPLAGLRGGR